MGKTELCYTDEEMSNYLKGNYAILILMPIDFLVKKEIAVKEYAIHMGKKLAVTWKRFKEADLETIAKLVAQNYISGGAEKAFYEINDNELQIEIVNWPNKNFLKALAMEKEMINDFFFVIEPIAEYLEMKYSFESTEDGYILKFNKK